MRVLRFLFGNWYARAYLLVVAAVAVLVALVLWIGGEKGNLAGVRSDGRPRRAREPLLTGRGKGGGSIPAQASTTVSPRRMVPPLTTEA